jgi:hypothetical protein
MGSPFFGNPKGSAYLQRLVLEIYVLPLEPQEFALHGHLRTLTAVEQYQASSHAYDGFLVEIQYPGEEKKAFGS